MWGTTRSKVYERHARGIERIENAKGEHEGEETDLERPTKRRVKQQTGTHHRTALVQINSVGLKLGLFRRVFWILIKLKFKLSKA